MKKLLLLVFATATLCWQSCSRTDEQITDNEMVTTANSLSEEDIQGLLQLRSDIQNYNMSISHTETRGLRSWITKALTVVAADGIGLLAGGAGSSALFSGVALVAVLAGVDKVVYDVTVDTHPTKSTRAVTDYTNLIIDHHGFTTIFADSVGYYHNQIVHTLLTDPIRTHQFNTQLGFHKAYVFNDICNNMSIPPVANSNDTVQMQAIYNTALTIGQMALLADTHNDFFDYLRSSPATAKLVEAEADVLEAFVDGLSEIDIDDYDGSYLNGVLHILDNSNISTTLKQKLGNIMITTNASAVLWGNSNLFELLEE